MKNDEYYTIQEYATIMGISTQAVYKQLPTRLQTYVVKVGNRKYLKKSVIQGNLENPTNKVATEVTNQIDNLQPKVTNQTNQPQQPQIDDVLKVLTSQLAEKDKQIAQLNKQIETQGTEIEKLMQLLDQEQKTNQAQLLSYTKQNTVLIPETATAETEPMQKQTTFIDKFLGIFK